MIPGGVEAGTDTGAWKELKESADGGQLGWYNTIYNGHDYGTLQETRERWWRWIDEMQEASRSMMENLRGAFSWSKLGTLCSLCYSSPLPFQLPQIPMAHPSTDSMSGERCFCFQASPLTADSDSPPNRLQEYFVPPAALSSAKTISRALCNPEGFDRQQDENYPMQNYHVYMSNSQLLIVPFISLLRRPKSDPGQPRYTCPAGPGSPSLPNPSPSSNLPLQHNRLQF